MLSILILIGVAILFNRKALTLKRNPYLWSAIGVLSFLALPFIMALLIVLLKREWLDEEFMILIASFILGFIGISVAYYVLEKLPNSTDVKSFDSDLLDNNID
jgi:drug/metabolite transporter (DMT)-like permease